GAVSHNKNLSRELRRGRGRFTMVLASRSLSEAHGMETVQIQCGSCSRVMAVSVEHLGSQGHWPHCQAVGQAPPAKLARNRENDTESIFAGPELADDIFGGGPGKLVFDSLADKKDSPKQSAGPVFVDASSFAPANIGAANTLNKGSVESTQDIASELMASAPL